MARTNEQSSRREALLVVMLTRISKRFGRGDWIRTSDPLRPRQVRYQAALRPDRPPHVANPILPELLEIRNAAQPKPKARLEHLFEHPIVFAVHADGRVGRLRAGVARVHIQPKPSRASRSRLAADVLVQRAEHSMTTTAR